MKNVLLSTALAALSSGAAFGATVKTAEIDFVALVAGIGEQGVEGQTFSFGGLDVTVTSSADAYLDGVFRGRPAGLGVCSSGLTADKQCTVASDDHVSEPSEYFTLTFSQGIDSMSDFMFRGRRHVDLTGTNGNLAFDLADANGAFGTTASTFAGLEGDVAGSATGPITSFTLSGLGEAFYLSSFNVSYTIASVPVPASGLLFGSALLGAGALRRRRKSN